MFVGQILKDQNGFWKIILLSIKSIKIIKTNDHRILKIQIKTRANSASAFILIINIYYAKNSFIEFKFLEQKSQIK